MKKQIIYLAFILVAIMISFTSCEDENSAEKSKLQYKWTADKMEYYLKAGTLVHTEDVSTLGAYMTFKSDGTFETNLMSSSTANEEITTGTYTYKDDVLTLKYTENSQTQTDNTKVLLLSSTNVQIKVFDIIMGENEEIIGDMIVYLHH